MFHGYRVSNTGRCQWNDNGTWVSLSRRIDINKFVEVRLKVNGKYKDLSLARLVATLFVPNPGNHRIVTHIDGDRENCSAGNLMWVDGVKSVSKEKALNRIKRKHGEKYIMIGEFMGALVPTDFKCQCGHIFKKAPNRMYTEDAPCEQCRKEAKEEIKKQRDIKREKDKEKAREERLRNARNTREHSIYVYIFRDGCAYVGLTNGLKRRSGEHKKQKNISQVAKHSNKTGIPVPDPIVVERNLTPIQAKIKECLWTGWVGQWYKMLNVAPSGSLGAYNLNHTLDEARELLKKGLGRTELRDHYSWAYERLKDANELPPLPYQDHTIEEAMKLQELCKGRMKLKEKYYWAYKKLKTAGKLIDKKNADVSIEEITSALEKYPTRSLLNKFARRAYDAARYKGMLPPKPPKEPKKRNEPSRRYNIVEHTLENALVILERCKTRTKLSKYPWAYDMLKEHGYLPKKERTKCYYGGGRPKWSRKVRRTSAELAIKWV